MSFNHSIAASRSARRKRAADNEARLVACWEDFQRSFPSELDCLEEIYRRATSTLGASCRFCASKEVVRSHSNRVLKCSSCGKTAWITSDTFFCRVRKARPWLGAIWLMEHGISLSSARFHRLAGVSTSTALLIFRKLMLVIVGEMGDEYARSADFLCVFARRSIQTPAGEHPRAEQRVLEDSCTEEQVVAQQSSWHSGQEKAVEADCEKGNDPDFGVAKRKFDDGCDSVTASDHSYIGEQEGAVLTLLSQDPVHFDDLCQQLKLPANQLAAALTILELAGLASAVVGNRYVRCSHAKKTRECNVVGLNEVSSHVDAAVDFIKVTYDFVSRKYLQLYLAAHWCTVDRVRWARDRLLEACLRSIYFGYSAIREYVSPLTVKIAKSI